MRAARTTTLSLALLGPLALHLGWGLPSLPPLCPSPRTYSTSMFCAFDRSFLLMED